MEEEKQQLINLLEESDDDECISFLLGCFLEFNNHRKELGVI